MKSYVPLKDWVLKQPEASGAVKYVSLMDVIEVASDPEKSALLAEAADKVCKEAKDAPKTTAVLWQQFNDLRALLALAYDTPKMQHILRCQLVTLFREILSDEKPLEIKFEETISGVRTANTRLLLGNFRDEFFKIDHALKDVDGLHKAICEDYIFRCALPVFQMLDKKPNSAEDMQGLIITSTNGFDSLLMLHVTTPMMARTNEGMPYFQILEGDINYMIDPEETSDNLTISSAELRRERQLAREQTERKNAHEQVKSMLRNRIQQFGISDPLSFRPFTDFYDSNHPRIYEVAPVVKNDEKLNAPQSEQEFKTPQIIATHGLKSALRKPKNEPDQQSVPQKKVTFEVINPKKNDVARTEVKFDQEQLGKIEKENQEVIARVAFNGQYGTQPEQAQEKALQLEEELAPERAAFMESKVPVPISESKVEAALQPEAPQEEDNRLSVSDKKLIKRIALGCGFLGIPAGIFIALYFIVPAGVVAATVTLPYIVIPAVIGFLVGYAVGRILGWGGCKLRASCRSESAKEPAPSEDNALGEPPCGPKKRASCLDMFHRNSKPAAEPVPLANTQSSRLVGCPSGSREEDRRDQSMMPRIPGVRGFY